MQTYIYFNIHNTRYRVVIDNMFNTYTAQKYTCRFLDGCEDWDFYDIRPARQTIDKAYKDIEEYTNTKLFE